MTCIRDGPLFFPLGGGGGGIVIGKKIVCMRKNAEINCLPQRCIWKKLSAETTYVMQDLRNFLKNCLHGRSGGKNLASTQSMVEKNFLPPRNHDTPRGKIMVRPLKASHGKHFHSRLPIEKHEYITADML